MDRFKPLTLDDRPLVMDYLRRYPPDVSELTFTNLFVWRGTRPIWMGYVEDCLIFLSVPQDQGADSRILFGPPAGPTPLATVLAALGPEGTRLERVPQATAEAAQKIGMCIVEDRDNFDYVYRVSDLAELSGRRYHKKRNLVKQCLSQHTCDYEAITPALIQECREFQDRWCSVRQCGLDPGLCGEYEAIREMFDQYQVLDLIGGAIRVDGIIQAFSVGEQLNPDTAVCHFEKAMPDVQGLSQLINHWFALHSIRGFEYENREQDLGIAGLRQAKESYYPHHLISKYRVYPPSASQEAGVLADPHVCERH